MECHHATARSQPIQEHGNVAVTNKYFRMFFNFVAQEFEQLNRAKPAARAEDRRYVVAMKKSRQIVCASGRFASKISFALENSGSEFHCIALRLYRRHPGAKRRTVNTSRRCDNTDTRSWHERGRFIHSHERFPQPNSRCSELDRCVPVDNLASRLS